MKDSQEKIAVLIVAGGSGSRMESDIPKQYMALEGAATLRHTLAVFEQIDAVSTLLCVIGGGHDDLYQQALDGSYQHPFVYGGESRQASVLNGLTALEKENPDIVLIHDAARPCVTDDDINRLIHSVKKHRAATLAQPVTESLQRDNTVIDRENLWIIQTPQGFYFQDILAAHKSASGNHTDDTSVYMAWSNKPVHYVPCGRHNLKITTREDLKLASKLLNKVTMENITGMGFDVHAFSETPANTIRLCGLDIPYSRSLKGHSDADVGLHALTDALFGAMADGDIGSHFPPSNNAYKNMDSHVFLDKALTMLQQRGGSIRHIDITFMCEEPKIGPHRDKIRAHLAQYLHLAENKISVKATTTEKLGFTGRGEGIACHAIVTIRIPADD